MKTTTHAQSTADLTFAFVAQILERVERIERRITTRKKAADLIERQLWMAWGELKAELDRNGAAQ